MVDVHGRHDGQTLPLVGVCVNRIGRLYGIKVTGMLASPWAYVPPNRGLSFNGTLSGVFPIASGTSHVEMDVLVVYDTVPSTGLRTSYRKVESDLNWVDGNYSSSGAVKTIEQTEN
jgi:hypothetical protein